MLTLKSTSNSFESFGDDVQINKIPPSKYKKTILSFKKIKYCSEKEAIELIKNLVLASTHVSPERFDFQTYLGEALLHLTKFIKINKRSKNFKIMYALYKSQVKKDEKHFKKHVNMEVIECIASRISAMVNKDKEHSEPIIKNLHILIKKCKHKQNLLMTEILSRNKLRKKNKFFKY